ncbi:tubulin-specific chaperone D-like [Lingula anatina]|uniref:Tubulin-specific chaperone D n=1 Tax=Lingula anatina TaxID=7574 RepID=A0A1S3K523_LINAN|nr:tubulin-specific chaperone D-like [Lingula anatina]|eukprot:XP_013417607.2 tubulin-specific chaperone D-like [Lingula anatina]
MAAETEMEADEQERQNLDALGEGLIHEEFKEADEVSNIISTLKDIYTDQIAVEMALERFTVIMDSYQEQPHLLDPHLEKLLGQLIEIVRESAVPMPVIHLVFKCLYLITKVRGYKVIVRLMPHEVADVEPVLALLAQQNPMDHETWETRYVLMIWLSIVCMIPFDMVRLDSNIKTATGEVKKPIMDRILDVVKIYLNVNDKALDAAAYCAARFMTRPDVKKKKLPELMDWLVQGLVKADTSKMQGVTAMRGELATLAAIFKHGKREDVIDFAPIVLEKLGECNLREVNNTILRKLAIKIVQRLGLTFLKFRVAAWRYQRGSRSLAENLALKGLTPAVAKPTMVHTKLEDDEEEEFDIPDEMEEVIEQLLNGLKDKDTIVRWSAAKGVGRVTGRLPQELADEVVGSVLELFSLRESDAAWHGGCLALAELGRRGLLLPERLSAVVPIVLKALAYDEKKGDFSVGAHVRDAACYVCWAFARAYDPEEIKIYVNNIACSLVIASVFDREVNVRRAASAAFQENVGRQCTFPHGIDILTTADYHAVGNRTYCYLELSVFVAQFPEYTKALIDHLAQVKVNRWDSVIRELAAQALYKLTPCSPEYMANTILPALLPQTTGIDLNTRHGTILAVAHITQGLAEWAQENGKKITDVVDPSIIDGLKNIAKTLQDAKLFRGLGGELMRRAVSCLIEKLSIAKMPYHNDTIIDCWQEIIDDCLRHIEPSIQAAATSAIPAFFSEYHSLPDGSPKPEFQEKILTRYLEELKSIVEITRMGFSQAIGQFPKFMLQGKLKPVLQSLNHAATVMTDKDKTFAEARKEALNAMTCIFHTVGVETDGSPHSVICKENIHEQFDILFVAMGDYTLDSRGDVGAWVREAAMCALCELITLTVKVNPTLITAEITKHLFCCLVQQASEKIDRTRALAGETFMKLLYHSPEIPNIPHKEELLQIFPWEEIKGLNWAVPSDTFPRLTKLLSVPVYCYSVLLGMTVSVGGLTESLVKHSGTSLIGYLKSLSNDAGAVQNFADVLIKIFKDYQKVDRVSLPMLKMLDQLLTNGCFQVICEDESNTFPMDLLTLCKQEISRSGAVQKLLASIDIFCTLLQFSSETKKKALIQLMVFLCHRYPIIRKTTANKVYEALVTYEEVGPDENLDELLTLLSETSWDDEVEKLRPMRNQLCSLFNVPPPVMKKQPMKES